VLAVNIALNKGPSELACPLSPLRYETVEKFTASFHLHPVTHGFLPTQQFSSFSPALC
jgi:hypothetical protein